jgi:hypothetical protein
MKLKSLLMGLLITGSALAQDSYTVGAALQNGGKEASEIHLHKTNSEAKVTHETIIKLRNNISYEQMNQIWKLLNENVDSIESRVIKSRIISEDR